MRRIHILHTTHYHYDKPVQLLEHTLLLRPREGHDIRIESSRLEIEPDYEIRWHRDVTDNSVARVSFSGSTRELRVTSEVLVQHYEGAPLKFSIDRQAENFPFRYDPMEQIDLLAYLNPVFPQDHQVLATWIAGILPTGETTDTQSLLARLSKIIAGGLTYTMREEPGVQSPAQTLALGSGSCRDLATLFMEACRYLGFATRFVSGYLLSSSSVTDFLTTHAWAEVYLPGSGWRGFDTTSAQLVSGDHIAVAVHRHPEAVPPIAGSFTGPPGIKPHMEVEVRVHLPG